MLVRKQDCIKTGKLNIAQYLFLGIIVFLMALRIHYSIDFTDESWYVAEPYVTAMKWSLPFVNNISQSPCMTFPLSAFFAIWRNVKCSTEGIVLFGRYLYLCVSLLMNYLTVAIYNRHSEVKIPIIIIGLQIVFSNSYSLFELNYNTIGMIYLPLVLALCIVECSSEKRDMICGIIMGGIAARMILGSPQTILALIVIVVYLIIEKRINKLFGGFIGILNTVVLVLVWNLCRGKGITIFKWIEAFFSQPYFKIASRTTKLYTAKSIMNFMISMVIWVIIGLLIRRIQHNKVLIQVMLASLSITIYGFVYLIRHGDELEFNLLTIVICAIPLMLYVVERNYWTKVGLLISFAYYGVYLFSSIFNIYGFGSRREYWLWYPVVITLILLYNRILIEIMHNKEKMLLSLMIVSIIICLMKLYNNIAFVYRDDSLEKLNTKVSEGIWKGIYTTAERANCVTELECFLRNNTKSDDRVLFLDWVSFGYLMNEGQMCSPSTLDVSYTYNVNNPMYYYNYFIMEQEIPSKIIYVDYGRDERLSIDCDEWKFNELVEFYSLSDEYDDEMFKVRIYSIEDEMGAWEYLENTDL